MIPVHGSPWYCPALEERVDLVQHADGIPARLLPIQLITRQDDQAWRYLVNERVQPAQCGFIRLFCGSRTSRLVGYVATFSFRD